MEPAERALEKIKQLHSPEYPPEGFRSVDGSTEPFCSGCMVGDPFLDPKWPCETRKIADNVKFSSSVRKKRGW
jgi:hypothetical protein